jgi:hypothetical protein
MAAIDDILIPSLILAEQGSPPATPSASHRRLFVGSDGLLKWIDSAGATSPLVTLNKWDATTAPDVDDDDSAGYAVGSRWIDVTGDAEYVCLDASTGAAVWTETTAEAAGGLTTDTLGTTSDGGSDETTAGSRWWGKLVTPANAGMITGIGALIRGTAAAVDFGIYAAIYDDNSSVPQNVIAFNFPGGGNGTGIRLNATDRWLWVPISYYAAASTPIWIVFGMVNWDTSNFTIAYAGSGSDYNGPSTSVAGDASIASTAPSSTANDYSLQAKLLR